MCRPFTFAAPFPKKYFAILLVLFTMIIDQHGGCSCYSAVGSRHNRHATASFVLSAACKNILPCWKQSSPRCSSQFRTRTRCLSLFGTAQNDQIDSSSSMTTQNCDQHPPSESTDSKLMETLMDRFCGDFDNYRQVVQDRKNGLLPREGGGHEHIHAVFVPVTKHARLAAFYFDGNPNALFRFRYYHFVSSSTSSPENVELVDTYLYTLSSDLYAKLSHAHPIEWSRLFREHLEVLGNENEEAGFSPDDDGGHVDLTQVALHFGAIQNLPRCEVRWSWELDPVQHSYIDTTKLASSDDSGNGDVDGLHAVMVHGEATVVSSSQNSAGRSILIRDQLSLYEHLFYIHDRGWDPDTMEYIYGNQRGVPYLLERVTRRYANGTMILTDPDLSWTLGTAFRSSEEYRKYLDQIGGPPFRQAQSNSPKTK